MRLPFASFTRLASPRLASVHALFRLHVRLLLHAFSLNFVLSLFYSFSRLVFRLVCFPLYARPSLLQLERLLSYSFALSFRSALLAARSLVFPIRHSFCSCTCTCIRTCIRTCSLLLSPSAFAKVIALTVDRTRDLTIFSRTLSQLSYQSLSCLSCADFSLNPTARHSNWHTRAQSSCSCKARQKLHEQM